MANPRRLAVMALLKVENDGAYSNLILNSILKSSDASKEDKALSSAIFYGTLERRITLDFVLSSNIKTPLKKVSPFTRCVLKTGLYQIMYMDKIPDSAAVNEAVKLIKKSKESKNSGFVNAVLRNVIRNGVKIPNGTTSDELSIRYSCPVWIIESLITDYGLENTLNLLDESLKPAPITIRVNTLKTNSDDLINEFKKLGINCSKGNIEDSLILLKGLDVASCNLFKKGLFHVQDTASQTAVSILNPKENERVMDMCAAPGGKSFTIAERMNNKGHIISADLYSNRLNLISSSLERLGIKIINPMVLDASKFYDNLGEFNCILCDVPCSGLGIIRRKPDIKYKDTDENMNLPEIQLSILTNASKYLLKGGRILYSTCTLRKSENENVVRKFINTHKNYHIMYEHTYMPHIDRTDGFYCALLETD